MTYSQQISKALLDINAVGFSLQKPILFKSGILSPVYVDNRIFPAHIDQWQLVIRGFQELIRQHNIHFDMIAGIEAAGIPHSAALGFATNSPSIFVRKHKKDHGTKKGVEGGDVTNKTVLLIEDHISTGGSSLRGVKSLREAGAKVNDCFAITSYGFKEADRNFTQQKVKLHTLTTFDQILAEAQNRQLLTSAQLTTINNWFTDPQAWTKKHESSTA